MPWSGRTGSRHRAKCTSRSSPGSAPWSTAIAAARGREIALVELTEEQAVAQWRAAGHPEEVIGFLLEAYGNTPEVGSTVVHTVEKVTGRPARTFAQWAADHADAFPATTA